MEAHSQYTDFLKAEIDRLEPVMEAKGTRLPLLAGLTDSQLMMLDDLVCTEGRVRGFGSYWQE
jgi:hypothetical protein